jgi:hypothetical protein
MEKLITNGITIFYEPQERATADQVRLACERSSSIVNEQWGLKIPPNSRLYVMTDWKDFMFQSSAGYRRLFLKVTYPLWAKRVQQMWNSAGGWNLPAKDGPVIGIKPFRLMQEGDPSFGGLVFIEEPDPDKKVQQVTCHELMHAITSHLKLPLWLREGFAMLMVDRIFECSTVKSESLELLKGEYSGYEAEEYREIKIKDPEYVAFQVVRGYWLTRYLAETKPDLLRSFLLKRLPRPELEAKVTGALKIDPENLWDEVDELLVDYFEQLEAPTY